MPAVSRPPGGITFGSSFEQRSAHNPFDKSLERKRRDLPRRSLSLFSWQQVFNLLFPAYRLCGGTISMPSPVNVVSSSFRCLVITPRIGET